MSRSLSYKGYTANIEFRSEDECFVGHIAGIKDIVGFHAESLSEVQTVFEEAVDDYLNACDQVGKPPQREQVVS